MSTRKKTPEHSAFSFKIDTSRFSAHFASNGTLVPWQIILIIVLALLLHWMPQFAEYLKLAITLLSA